MTEEEKQAIALFKYSLIAPLGRMVKQYDEAMERPHENLAKVTALVAEPEQKYGAEIFEENIQTLNKNNIFFRFNR